MDYRNADGSISEMCGNGVRVFARYLEFAGLVDGAEPLTVGTRDGAKRVTYCDDGDVSVDMGTPILGAATTVRSNGHTFDALVVDVGNPHAVAIVDSLRMVGDLSEPPAFSSVDFPDGTNVEFVEQRGDHQLSMRVFERGVGETASCGTGACAVGAAVAAQQAVRGPVTYAVDVAGGRLAVTLDSDGTVHLKGPAVLLAEGSWIG
jgi:diaminopimelate epimerase